MTQSTNPDDFAERLARARQDDNAHRHDDPTWDDLGPYDRRILTRRAQADLDRMAEIGLRVIDVGADAAMTPGEPNLVDLFRERVQHAHSAYHAATGHGVLEDMTLVAALNDLSLVLEDGGADQSPQIVAVARALVAPVDDLCETSRPMVQHILDGNLGQEAAAAVTHLVMLLADLKGQVQALERTLLATGSAAQWPACSQCGGSGYQPCAPGSPHPAATQDGQS